MSEAGEVPQSDGGNALSPLELLRARVEMYANEPALAVGEEVLTYAGWLERALDTAQRMAARGVRPGEAVLLRFSLETFLDYAVAYVATLAVRAVAVPLSEDLSGEEASRVREACGVAWSVTLSPGCVDGFVFESVGGGTRADQHPDPVVLPTSRPGPTDTAEILFTSGSTGDPQGVACPYGEIGFDYDLSRSDPGVVPRTADLHSAAFGTNFCQEMLRSPLKWGSLVITLPEYGVEAVGRAVDRHGVRALRLTPVMARALARRQAADVPWLAGIGEISVSSAFCSPEVLGRLQTVAPNAKVVNQYSLTESGRAKLKNVWGVDPVHALGKPVEGTQVRIVDDGRVCALGEVGEIQIRHVEAVPRSYVAPLDPTVAPSREGDGFAWVRTGDLGHLDSEGYVYLVDRAKDIVNVGGRKVSPLAVERVIGLQQGVADVAVCGIPHPSLGEIIAAMVVLERGLEGLPEFDLSGTLMAHEIPKAYVVSREVPRNRAGKVSRRAVREAVLARERPTGGPARAADDDELAEAFRAICTQVLEQDVQDLDVSWYSAGGDSIGALEVLVKIEEAFGVDLAMEVFGGEMSLRDIMDEVRLLLVDAGSGAS